jgi:hypothetical protein
MTRCQFADQSLARHPGRRVLGIAGYNRNAAVHNGVPGLGTHLLFKPFGIDQPASRRH